MVHCVLLKREAEGLDYLPYPGELGKRIYDNVSKEAWAQWVAHQTMLINENRLTPDRAEGAGVPGQGDGEVLFRRGLGEAEGVRADLA